MPLQEGAIVLCFSKIALSELTLTFDPWDEFKEKIRSKPEYQNLKDEIGQSGFLDPLLVREKEGKFIVDTGTQRLMIAREMGEGSLNCFLYGENLEHLLSNHEFHRIRDKSELGQYFRNGEVNTLLDILGYLSDGTIQL